MEKSKQNKYDVIIDAAVRVIAESGYHKAQVSKIAKEANVADGTIYLYFKNKDDLLISMFNKKMGQFVDVIQGRIDQETTVDGKLRALIATHLEMLNRDQALAMVTQLELRQPQKEIRDELGKIVKRYQDVIAQIIAEGVETGYFRPDIDQRMARRMIFGTLDETVTAWVMKGCKYDMRTQVEPLHQLLKFGMVRME
ncbi:TetR/AcrR family transcriptional regulator [Rubeoparvulum massiliense]|uniref:TetR/AcrR family transcriptional regulator n=1 Tax=Rubeoparvulum massiliense TaxID=1631346 RepID=UPI00065DE75A|nr:TetR/AcrR family transcriptional regulator [Rubeoparvulum massiliense]